MSIDINALKKALENKEDTGENIEDKIKQNKRERKEDKGDKG